MVSDYLIKWTDKEGNILDIRNALDIRVTTNTATESDSAEILLPYRRYVLDGDIIFNKGETLAMYMKNNGLIDSVNPSVDDLIFTASIEDFERQMSAGILKLICTNLTYDLLSNLFNQDVTNTAPHIVNLVVQNASQNGIDQTNTNTNIQQLKSDGTPFDTVNFVSAWKNSYDCIKDLSGTGNTGDNKDYLFWFDPDGTFNWIYPPDTVETFEITYDDGVSNLQHRKEDTSTVAMVIYNAGPDQNGVDTYGFKYNEFAENIKGAVRYYPMVDISKLLTKANFAPGDNNAFIAEQKRQAEIRADTVISKFSGGIDKTTCDIKGRKFNMAKLYKVKSPMFPSKELRLTRVVHTFNRNGWKTKLELEEDVIQQ